MVSFYVNVCACVCTRVHLRLCTSALFFVFFKRIFMYESVCVSHLLTRPIRGISACVVYVWFSVCQVGGGGGGG